MLLTIVWSYMLCQLKTKHVQSPSVTMPSKHLTVITLPWTWSTLQSITSETTPWRQRLCSIAVHQCNGHYNRTPDLGKCGMWWNVWDLARHTILDAKVLDRIVTWLTKHKDTS